MRDSTHSLHILKNPVSQLLSRESKSRISTFKRRNTTALPRGADRPSLRLSRSFLSSSTKPKKSFLSRSFRKSISLDQILPGPRIHTSHPYFHAPYNVAFDPLQENCLGGTADSRRARSSPFYRKMKIWLQFLSTPTADTPGTTLVLHFDQKRYLIGNVGEGTQRAAVQRKLPVTKVGDIFLTGPISWGNAGGVLGMILTVADCTASAREQSKMDEAKKKNKRGPEPNNDVDEGRIWLNIYGGRNLTHLLATARRFIFRKGMPLRTTEFRPKKAGQQSNWDPTWQDDFIKVWDLVIEPEEDQCLSQRKRSHEEFSADSQEVTAEDNKESTEEKEERFDQMRKSVVSSMFDSKWRLDALLTRKLSEVALPAAIFVRNEQGKIEKYRGPMLEEGKDVPDIDVLVRSPWPGALIEELPPTTPSTNSVCYIIKGHSQRGKFDAKAAIDLGIQPGPNFKLLTLGESVKTASGSVVTPEMVMGPTKAGGGFAIVELPSVSYVKSLLMRGEWQSTEVMDGVAAIIWILGPGVLDNPSLQKFMADRSHLKHIVSSKDCCSNYLALESPASAAIRLNLIDPERFPIPNYNNSDIQQQSGEPRPYEKATPGLTLQLEPQAELQHDKIIHHLDMESVIKEMPKEVLDLAEVARAKVLNPEYLAKLDENQKDIPSKDAEIVTLGTGSALPSKYRNVSATLIRVPGYGTYLLDCGENTLGQLKRVYGEELPEVLRDLKAIWISHLHADHHLGTNAVIKAWAAETAQHDLTKNNKLHVVSHEGMINWLKEYSEVEDYGYERVETLMAGKSNSKYWDFNHHFKPQEVKETGISSIQACTVEHCHGAAAVVINFPNGFKLAYSGDCRPSENFVRIGQGATLLVHEATFDDELQGDAIAKKHSTTAEALGVGRRMNARRILLTHFSQRYQKIPVMDSHGGKDQVAIVAFDYMRVKLEDFAKLDAFKPALMKLYADDNV
ncbi:Ribonuclease Z [Lachnellula willkommii]|uniref:ribonuclease Z n=1 Tax=Lachnellula willkommii TaxID=215461 RepID=A0A559MD73_9HELO|nr:Ribonuclease Z [Lachnellula willkommii]